ncbi:DUF1990 family protein [Cystobacter ferrugineus]|uniref:DUF1990 domain-containing protein n=1 Tax=Cystobacter ferrugineus TaxID=83449 RepID=A0A1L9B879_9BACT|nr:DUF1990 family protein [Cystobacter ferrugineus]OJH38413.1 hypothetical protein BON30_25150 [Cystobacter ferrugineus]
MTNVEWRLMSGWSDKEVMERLARASTLPLNFEVQEKDMTADNGWSQVESQAIIGCDPPGPPKEGDAFHKLKDAVTRMGFSDPRIVHGHFSDTMPLLGRPMMLELRPLVGLRYLCPVRVRAVRSEVDDERTVYGFSIDTLQGHVEAGREWFQLSKAHHTGELRFHIRAAWREGQFPNWWSYVGFELVGRRYQRAWHHLAHQRLRELLRGGHLEQHPDAQALQEANLRVSRLPVQFASQRGLSRRLLGVEHEVERDQGNNGWSTLGLGVLAGMRGFSAPALLGVHFSREPRTAPSGNLGLLASPLVSRALAVLAAGEVVADKTPWIPARISPPALVGRALSGALVGAAVSPRRQLAPVHAVLGAAAAVASSFTFYALRRFMTRRLGVPNVVAGLAEDAVAAALGGKLFAALR